MVTLLRHSFLLIVLAMFFSVGCCQIAYGSEIKNPTEQILAQSQDKEQITEAMEDGFSFGAIIKNIYELFLKELKTMSKGFPILFLVLIFYGIKGCMDFPFSLDRTVSLGCFSVTALTAGKIFSELSQSANELITHLSQFVYLTIPALTGLIANGGRVLTATKSTYFILGFINILVFSIEKFFFPAIILYFVFSVISALLEKDYFSAVKSTLSSLIKTALPLLIGIFTTVLSIITSVSKASDELTVKTAKMALGNCIPFLGNVLSESGEYLIQTVSQIKAQAGLAGILVLCYIFLVPLFKVLAGLLLFKLLCVFSGFFNDAKTTEFYENISSSLGMLSGIMGTMSVLVILSMMILMGV